MSANTQDQYLHEHRAWNWQWPQSGNRWYGKSTRRGPSMPYSGPSKRTVAKRASRAVNERRSH